MRVCTRMVVGLVAVVSLGCPARAKEKDPAELVKKAVERSTLDQSGTKPFHLRAVLAPSFSRDQGSNRTGEVEIWWVSPTQWRREVRSPGFHQIDIVNGQREWERNEGDYFPEWLREVAIELVEPVPNLPQVLKRVDEADVKSVAGSVYCSWTEMSTNGTVQKGMGAAIAVTGSTGLLFYGGGLGWGGMFKDYQNFHGRMVARTVSSGTPEVTAKVITLEDLGNVPSGFFDATASGGDATALRTALVEETALRKNLLTPEPTTWPPIKDGPLEGILTTTILVDRTGKVQEIGTIVSDNPALDDAARKAIAAMRFKPYTENGIPAQVLSRITMAYKTVRPAGMESFDSARSYFERGWHVGFPAAGSGPSYVLHATFQATVRSGHVATGEYTDTWRRADEWRREAKIEQSDYVRTQHGDKRYELAKGPDVSLLRFVLRAIEPIPAADTFVESDWKIKRDPVGGINAIRVLAGYESPNGNLDPEQARAYWFDADGKLLKTYFNGIETRRSDFKSFGGTQVAQQIMVFRNGELAMLIRVTELASAGTLPDNIFDLRGNEWQRAFTSEMR